MITLDTNALVSFLTGDNPERMAAVLELVKAARPDAPVLLSVLVVYEAAFVLVEVLKVPRAAARDALLGLLNSSQFEVERADEVAAALTAWTSRRVGFADLLILEWARAHQATLYTADRALARRAGAVLLG